MMTRFLAALLITGILLVAGLNDEIRPNIRQLEDDDDDATIIAEYYIKVIETVESAPFIPYAENVLDFLEGKEGLPPFSSEEMMALVMEVFPLNEDGSADVPGGLLNATERLSASSPVMAVANEFLSKILAKFPDLIVPSNAFTRRNFATKVNDAAEKSGLESEMVLASISFAVGKTANEWWNYVFFIPSDFRKLSPDFSSAVIPDMIGAIVGYALGGIIGAILFELLSSDRFFVLERILC